MQGKDHMPTTQAPRSRTGVSLERLQNSTTSTQQVVADRIKGHPVSVSIGTTVDRWIEIEYGRSGTCGVEESRFRDGGHGRFVVICVFAMVRLLL